MLVDYFYWQYVIAPRWLVALVWNLQRALLRLFSVPLMLRTLIAPWHRDTIAFHGGTLGQFGLTFLWNIISRLIGALVRTVTLALWVTAAVALAALSVIAIPALLAWPALVLVGVATSLAVLAL